MSVVFIAGDRRLKFDGVQYIRLCYVAYLMGVNEKNVIVLNKIRAVATDSGLNEKIIPPGWRITFWKDECQYDIMLAYSRYTLEDPRPLSYIVIDGVTKGEARTSKILNLIEYLTLCDFDKDIENIIVKQELLIKKLIKLYKKYKDMEVK